MTLVWRPGFQFDADASTYIEAVEAADTQALETGVRNAINDFVIGCKNDGIWDAIKASCILAGARTLAGALVPLVGTAPTNYNFVSGDYSRKLGLDNNGANKYLDSNRANNADPQDSKHVSLYASVVRSRTYNPLLGTGNQTNGHTLIAYGWDGVPTRLRTNVNSNFSDIDKVLNFPVFIGTSRSTSSSWILRESGISQVRFRPSDLPVSDSISIFNGLAGPANARIAFYSIGESLDLAALDTRVSNLITAIGAAIP